MRREYVKTITAKQLKQKTGEVIKRIRAGEKLTLTYRGKAIAIIQPTPENSREINPRPFDEAWKDIEETLSTSEPRFSNWKEATAWIRNRI